MSSVPSSPVRIAGPEFEVKLSAFDAKFSGFYSRRILVFRTDSLPTKVFDILAAALHRLVQKIPILGGVVHLTDKPGPNGQMGWKQIKRGDGIILHAKDLRSVEALCFRSLEAGNFSPELLPDDLLMPIPPEGRVEPFDVAELQLNFVKGGVLLSCCFAHISGDGTAMNEMLRLLARYSRDVQNPSGEQLSTSPPIGLDRTALLGLKAKYWTPDDHQAMEIRRPVQNSDSVTKTPVMVQRIYKIRESMLLALKEDATTVRISTNDAITSVVWRALAVNRIASGAITASDPNMKLKLFSSVSSQSILGLPSDFIGNTFLLRLCEASVKDILDPKSLSELAALHRSEVNRVTPELIAGYCQMAESAEVTTDFSPVLLPIRDTTGFVVTSFYHREILLQSDWGSALGNYAERLRCTDQGFGGALRPLSFILPHMPNNLGGEVQLDVYPDGISAMEEDKLFSKYFEV